MAGDTTAIQRLRRVIYWASLLFGLLLAAIGAAAVWIPPDYGPAVAMAAIGFIVPYLIGWAARLILASEQD